MEELGTMWQQEQEIIYDLRSCLLYTKLELEQLKKEANEEIKKSKDNVRSLLSRLNIVEQERDEARSQLQKLLNMFMPPEIRPPQLVLPPKANSSITESNSLSQGTSSSPVDSFLDHVSSPEFSNFNNTNNVVDSVHMGYVNEPSTQDYNNSSAPPMAPPIKLKTDSGTQIIDEMVKWKTLPKKGNLLQTVLEAGPLLQTLLIAGPLPRWRNPPPLNPSKIPPVDISGYDQKSVPLQAPIASRTFQKPLISSLQTCSSSVLNFNKPTSASCNNNASLFNNHAPLAKRQRFQ